MKQGHDKLEKVRMYLGVGMQICDAITNDVLDHWAEGKWDIICG